MGVDLFTVSAQAINFLILLWLLRRFLWLPVTRVMEQRETAIAATHVQAAFALGAAEARAHALQREHEVFQQQRREREAELAREFAGLREEQRERLAIEAAELRERAAADLQQQQRDAEASLRRGVQSLVSEALARGWRDLTGDDLEGAIVARFEQRLRALDAQQRQRIADAHARGEVRLLTAGELDDAASAALIAALPLPTEGVVAPRVHFERDPALLAGVRLLAADTLVEVSVQARLDDLVQAWGRDPLGVVG